MTGHPPPPGFEGGSCDRPRFFVPVQPWQLSWSTCGSTTAPRAATPSPRTSSPGSGVPTPRKMVQPGAMVSEMVFDRLELTPLNF